MFKSRKGQSTVEYIVLVTAVIGAAIIFTATMKSKVQDSVGNTAEQITNMTKRYQNSVKETAAGTVTNPSNINTPATASECLTGKHFDAASGGCVKD
jgi:uncharacterized protein (UPF0333 family)